MCNKEDFVHAHKLLDGPTFRGLDPIDERDAIPMIAEKRCQKIGRLTDFGTVVECY